jgi:predicted acylesterase/phospholipase RssA
MLVKADKTLNLRGAEIILAVLCCFSWPAARAQTVVSGAGEPALAIGIVFTGGGSFGAFEAGALQAFFDRWVKDYGVAPPIRVIAGTSTGALIGPFVAMGSDGVKEVASLYQGTKRQDIFKVKLAVFLPVALFSKWSSSVYNSDPLERLLKERLSDDRLRRIAGLWPNTRVVVLATDFGTGAPAIYSNAPGDVARGLARMRDGILASSSTPLTSPPVYIKSGGTQKLQPHVDGGISQVAPLQALFDMAAQAPAVPLTHVIVISPYPLYPGSESAPVQQKRLPSQPNFGEIASRTGALIAESSISKEIALAWAAISLRNSGVSAEKVKERTGLNVAHPPAELIIIAPDTRLGWNTLKFNHGEMREMFVRGVNAKPRPLIP